ncbi:hypothetical protein [Pedobacter caeni]|uniref:Uncharacterized protein n=1 Tax=Pedobacter caeni TaxID=288992 RepID=A0A1M4ZUN5_9SPHI|nr:hypothetical protein [Pedobacter caeni]SHF21739.1 hypothetical protein SAMN04488522_102472 [Pedobacter caeni]
MSTFFRLSSALAIVMIASSFTAPKELSAVPKAKVSFLPPGVETQTISIPFTSQTATATLNYNIPGSPPYNVKVSINGTGLTNIALDLANHSGGTIILDTFKKHVIDAVSGVEYDIEVKVSGYGTKWRIDSFTVFSVLV